MEQHDPLGQRHRSRRPGDHRRAQRRRDVEQVQGVGQHAHVPTGDHQRGGAVEQGRHLGAMLGDHRPVVWRQVSVELTAKGTGPGQVCGVKFPDRFDSFGQHARPQLFVAAAALDRVDGLQRAIRDRGGTGSHAAGAGRATPASGCARPRREDRVALGDVEPPPVQPEIDVPGAEQPAQLGVITFALLPPCGDRGDRPFGVERGHDPLQRRPALGSQQRQSHLSAPLAGASLGRAGGARNDRAGGWSPAPGHRNGAWGCVVPEARRLAVCGVRPGACGIAYELQNLGVTAA